MEESGTSAILVFLAYNSTTNSITSLDWCSVLGLSL